MNSQRGGGPGGPGTMGPRKGGGGGSGGGHAWYEYAIVICFVVYMLVEFGAK